jgi:predicted dehydrogenase/threonine dehydrogenase-like Zn-dependent dehydrogenase
MKQIVQNYRTGKLKLEDVPIPRLRDNGVLVRNHFSLISSGTEKSMIELAKKSIIGKARERPDLVKQVIDKVKRENFLSTIQAVFRKLDTPVPLGYSCAGEVIEVGRDIDEFRICDFVACAGAGYASHAEVVSVPKNLCVKIPQTVRLEQAAFTTLGAIALQGVRIADPTLGENFAVIGLGLLGLLTVQILRASGCRVLGIDVNEDRVKLSRQLGAHQVAIRGQADIHSVATAFSKGRGVDAVIITAATRSSDPVALAGEISRDRGRVVAVGAVKLDLPRKVYYEKELDLRLSRSYGPGRYDPVYEEKGFDYPIGYVRWTERRNMEEFLELIEANQINIEKIITHRFHIDDALKAYDLIAEEKKAQSLGVLLTYDTSRTFEKKILLSVKPPQAILGKRVTLGMVGAGNFALGTLLPILKGMKEVDLKGLATTGLTAKFAGDKYGFQYCTSDTTELFKDQAIHAVIIATRHDLHASLSVAALREGKKVFVEKPLAVSLEGLREVLDARRQSSGDVMVGFNRRFSPFIQKIKEQFFGRTDPLMLFYRVNAGHVPKEHWVHDPTEGGGRIVGEVCHFIDLLQFVCDSTPVRVYAETISAGNESIANRDNVIITIQLADGSIGSIGYSAGGDKSYSKERIEIFGNLSVGIIDDFKMARFFHAGKSRKLRQSQQDKGYEEELKQFLRWVKGEIQTPVSLEESALTTLATLASVDSIQKGVPVSVDVSVLDSLSTQK